jgi:drug/metabolite transporter (DMT)-like permease
MNQAKPWAAFIFLGTLGWGTSFLWIKIAVEEIGPFMLVALRLTVATVAAWAYLYFAGLRLPRQRKILGAMVLLGFINTAIPFLLISWGETRIDSGLAGILNGTMPLITVVIAHLLLVDDRFTPAKLVGLVLGFGGLVLLLSADAAPGQTSRDIWGQAAVLGAATLYSFSSVFVRRVLGGQHAIVISAGSLTAATAVIWIAAPIADPGLSLPVLPVTWLALVWLGLIGTTGAYLAYFYLIRTWGPTRSTMITYLFPVVAVGLGVIFLDEELVWQTAVGGLGVIGGIAIVNWRSFLPLLGLKPVRRSG